MRRIVESVIRQNQPPTLRMLALRVGYKDKKVLTGYFAGLCAELLAAAGPLRRGRSRDCEEHCNPTFGSNPLRQWPRCAARLSLQPLTVSRKFSAEYRLIVSRYQQRRRKMAGLPRLH